MYPVPPKPETAGRTEIALGKWLKTVPRHNVIVATKVYMHIYAYMRYKVARMLAGYFRTENHSSH